MNAIVMRMDNYEIEEPAAAPEYDDEILCAGWNPQLQMLASQPAAGRDAHHDVRHELIGEDVEAFLKKMYALS